MPDWYQSEYGITAEFGKTYGNFLDSLFALPDVASKVAKIFAGHFYWSDILNGQLVQRRQTLGSKMAPYFKKGYKYWMTEYCVMGSAGPYGNGIPADQASAMTPAIYVARIIHYDLTLCDAIAWQWWTALNAPGGLINSDISAQTINETKILWAFGNYSLFIRPGARRIGYVGADNDVGLMASTYEDSASSLVTIVLVNAATKNQKISVSFSGLISSARIKFLTPYVTDNNKWDNLTKFPLPIDSVYDVPAYSVVSLIGELDGGIYTGGTPCSATLLTPASGDTLETSNSMLVWRPVANAASYEVLLQHTKWSS